VAVTDTRIIVVADLATVGDERRWLEAVRALGQAARGRGVALQVRAKQLDPGRLSRLAGAAREAVPSEVLLILNGPAQLARELGFPAVHWPEDAIPAHAPPAAEGLIRFAAVHSLEAAARAARAGADAVVFGPVFPPRSKEGTGVGLAALRELAEGCSLPVFAIGGIDESNARACLEAGAAGVAVVGAVMLAPDPVAALDELCRAIESSLAAR